MCDFEMTLNNTNVPQPNAGSLTLIQRLLQSCEELNRYGKLLNGYGKIFVQHLRAIVLQEDDTNLSVGLGTRLDILSVGLGTRLIHWSGNEAYPLAWERG